MGVRRSSIAAVLTPHCLALIKHREINDHPIEVVAQYFTSLQRHCKSSALKGSDYAMSVFIIRYEPKPENSAATCHVWALSRY